jgi:hypothetical protein
VLDSFTVKINFRKNSIPSLKDIDYPLLPKHVYERIDRKDLSRLEKDIRLVTDGPFFLEKWDKNQAIILKGMKTVFFMLHPATDRNKAT